MAYTTVNGKLVKKFVVRQINPKMLTEIINKLVLMLIKEDPSIGYDITDNMQTAAQAMIQTYNLTSNELEDLLIYREVFEEHLDNEYKIDRGTGISNMMQDLGAHYKAQGVPQFNQVLSGFMDSIIGSLHMSTQQAA